MSYLLPLEYFARRLGLGAVRMVVPLPSLADVQWYAGRWGCSEEFAREWLIIVNNERYFVKCRYLHGWLFCDYVYFTVVILLIDSV